MQTSEDVQQVQLEVQPAEQPQVQKVKHPPRHTQPPIPLQQEALLSSMRAFARRKMCSTCTLLQAKI